MGLEGMEAIGCHETGCMNPPSPLKPPSPPNLTGVDCISYLFFSCLLLISNHFQNQGGKISRNCSSHDFPLLGDLHLAEIRFKGEKRVFEADKCFVCVSHWSFLPSLGDRRHNVEWSGEKSQSNATFVKIQPLKLEQPEDPCEERERSFSHRSFVQGEDDSCDTLWSVRAGQLDFVYVDFYSSGFY